MKLIVILLILFGSSWAVNDPKLSAEGINKDKSERKFRSGKVHQLWKKANEMNIPSVTLADLYLELKHHDHELMDLKVLQSQGGDKDGLKQARLQKEFNGILFKYGLAANNREEDIARDKESQKKNKQPFYDRKLNRLWKEVQTSGKFSQAELDKLFVEFKHHEDKLTELHSLNTEAEETHVNSPGLHPEEEKRKFSQIKELYEDVEEGYRRLQTIAKKPSDDSAPFTEPKVMDLWKMLQEGNFTAQEKKSLEEELRHFETRIEKHRHFRDELNNAAEKVEFHGGINDAPPEKLSRHERLKNKVVEMADKVHKSFVSLKKRLSVGVINHTEL